MGAFDKFIKNSKKPNNEIKYEVINKTNDKISNIIEISKILTNNDKEVVQDITMLSNDFDRFYKKHKNWCDDLSVSNKNDQYDILNAFAFLLCGYECDDETKVFGAYIDWKEETDEILLLLKDVVKNLKQPIDLDELKIDNKLKTYDALKKIDDFLRKSNYTIFTLDIGNDCYHLFITTIDDFERVKNLGREIEFNFG